MPADFLVNCYSKSFRCFRRAETCQRCCMAPDPFHHLRSENEPVKLFLHELGHILRDAHILQKTAHSSPEWFGISKWCILVLMMLFST